MMENEEEEDRFTWNPCVHVFKIILHHKNYVLKPIYNEENECIIEMLSFTKYHLWIVK